ncbi:nitroreductase family protein [Chrysiogenes arsenatis]|uniref:nitroreductase family protein n=1 Tax=Chrysiogenes arsenatis TaxID=309797 RepID=UPI000414EF34|nr:nitroreductase family protein [Chrysiogenes arsenatis]
MFFDCIRARRSIRKFTAQPVETEKIQLITEAALRAPSSRGRQPWEFYVVTSPTTLTKLARSKMHGSAFLGGTTLAIVVCADPNVSDVWIEDTAIAATYIQLAAQELGLASTWVQIRLRQHDQQTSSEAFLREQLNLPATLQVASIIGIGYPAETLPGWKVSDLPSGKIHFTE